LKVAVLVTVYPKASHAFIRREVVALEREGIEVERISIRPSADDLVDQEDLDECARTRVILEYPLLSIMRAVLVTALGHPVAFSRAKLLAFRLGLGSHRGLLRHIAYLLEACVLLRWCRESGIQHIHAHFGTNPPAVALLCRSLGGPPFSFTVHGPEEFERPRGLKLKEKMGGAAFTCAISEYGRGQLHRLCRPEDADRIHVVRCGVDGRFLAERATPLQDVDRFVCVGRLCEQKDQPSLVRAVACLRDEGVHASVVFAGDGEMRPEVDAMISALGVEDRITVTGWADVDRIRAEILSARALVLPSLAEGLPVVIMEAMALERPVVSTTVAAIPELVIPGETGWLIPAGSVGALTAAMREVLATPVERLRAMGASGREAVRARHDVQDSARALAHLIEQAQGSQGSAA